ncbi:DUF6361 family protein [Kribbella sp. NPDC050281]|uniref:DUF6361 family protein n=1 Tax=Kribbella sp. NPDC050281 TaxID=3155515 RepID=UPI0033DDD5E0
MASVFAWLDTDDEQQHRMRVLIDLFKEEGTVDELGIGTIRDAFSNALFPGTSILHTRCRYLLFNAWLMADTARHRYPTDRAIRQLRTAEVRLITALLEGGESTGVIGSQARAKLKQMPTSMYWAALGRYEMRTWDLSITAHLRAASQRGRGRAVTSDDDDAASPGIELGLDAALPAMPADLLESSTFDLLPDEASYLRDRIAASCHGSLFAWLALHGRHVQVGYVWNHPQLGDFPSEYRELLDHARRFHSVVRGAALLYNLLLAERRESQGLIEYYRDELAAWQTALATNHILEAWSLTDFWNLIRTLNPQLRVATQAFVTDWLQQATTTSNIADLAPARELIAQRELRLKGGRSRLISQAALDAWTGGSGLVPLDYRWGVARGYLNDIYAGLKVA